jgi:hypothetical protein
MEAYSPVPLMTRSRYRRPCSPLTAELAGPAAAGMTAFELEQFVDERRQEVLQSLLQDHYDLRGMREEQQARVNPPR